MGYKKFLSYEEAMRVVREEKIDSVPKFREWINTRGKGRGVPYHPERIYASSWRGFGDFFGTGYVRGSEFVSYSTAKKLVRDNEIKSSKEYDSFIRRGCGKELGLPSQPVSFYKDEWVCWATFLNSKRHTKKHTIGRKKFLPYEEAMQVVREANIRTQREFHRWLKNEGKGLGVPSCPKSVYVDQWRGLGEFLGTNSQRTASFLPYRQAQKLLQQAGVDSEPKFRTWIRGEGKGRGVPSHPENTYSSFWRGWGDFLGTRNGYYQDDFISYSAACRVVRSLGLTSSNQFKKWKKTEGRNYRIPSTPTRTYKNEWVSWYAFLNTDRPSRASKEQI